ncbi:ABC transporter permease subunit [Vagococcus zengguangii]|uniref:Uncharacterized protein n=1 Tax=Vagococcus zengguangii TaxID=2571750 RepID=A0A4D7CX00_9ENTE|nr:ABC transporter permease subunit [Vagococcus zengguangii]QCI86610.1 hypothetical protein FA707_06335 [Vagococcus zengguangii]TLG79754.1 hypothetical protein FE258_07785 [Vagococcus zengguangii]
MRQTFTFMKKEFIENFRNKKLMVIGILSLLFGFMNPIIAKFTPDLIANLVDEQMASMIPEPTIWDSWTQYYKNVGQMFLFIVIIMFADILTKEVSDKTLVPLVTKGLKKQAVLNGKALFLALIIWATLLTTASVTHLYNYPVFGTFGDVQSFVPLMDLGLFALFLVSCLMLGSVLSKGYGSLLFVALSVLLSYLMSIPTFTREASPIQLLSGNVARMTSGDNLSLVCYFVTIAFTVLFYSLASIKFNKKLLS